MKKWKYGFIVRFFLKMTGIVVIGWLILTYILGLVRVSGNSMFPSLKDGDLAILYKLESYYSNDIVQYVVAGKTYLGRIVAVPGREVDFPDEGSYLVDGYQPNEEIVYPTYAADNSNVSYPVKLGDTSYFILNDFRSDTLDSRTFGSIDQSQIKGKLIFLLRRRNF